MSRVADMDRLPRRFDVVQVFKILAAREKDNPRRLSVISLQQYE